MKAKTARRFLSRNAYKISARGLYYGRGRDTSLRRMWEKCIKTLTEKEASKK